MLGDGFHDVPPGKLAVVVTHLEMQTPAPLRPMQLQDGLAFRRVEADLDWYRDIYKRVGAQNWLWFARLRMTDERLLATISDPDVELYTVSLADRDEALLELDFREAGACELAYFGVTSVLIGSGVGRWLMNEAIARAWSRPIRRFHVHTCTIDSPQALPFYLRSGFSPVSQQVEIADDPRMLGELPKTAGRHVPLFKP